MATVRIYQPARTAMQSGRSRVAGWVLELEPGAPRLLDAVMGWTGSSDTRDQVRLKFDSREDAVAFAEKNKLDYRVHEPHRRKIRPKAYADNFAAGRQQNWTH